MPVTNIRYGQNKKILNGLTFDYIVVNVCCINAGALDTYLIKLTLEFPISKLLQREMLKLSKQSEL